MEFVGLSLGSGDVELTFKSISKMKRKLLLGALLATFGFLTACNNEKGIDPPYEPTTTTGLFILSEGWYGAGAGSLAHYNFCESALTLNVYGLQNPGKSIGDTPEDIVRYGAKTYITAWGEGKVLILDTQGKELATVQMTKPHSIAADGKYVYVSTYDSKVARIDTLDYSVTYAAVSGLYGEGIAVIGDNVYVANNGDTQYEQGLGETIMIVDKANMRETGEIPTPMNPRRLCAGQDGYLYLVTAGEYNPDWTFAVEPGLHRVNVTTKAVVDTFEDMVVSNITALGDYVYGCYQDWATGESYIRRVNVKNNMVSAFTSAESDYYSLTADPVGKTIYAGTSDGELVCYNTDGSQMFRLQGLGANVTAVAFTVK